MNNSHGLHKCLGCIQSVGRMLPPPVGPYIEDNLDTAPQLVNHVLFLLATCNTFLVLSTIGMSLMTFFAAVLLMGQCFLVVVVMNHSKLSFAPPALAPTDFMVGLCLGLCTGGVILSFFTAAAFRRFYDLCEYAEENYTDEDHQHACGNLTGRLWWNWLWCTLVFWLDLVTAFLIAAGRHELASSSEQQQYQSIGGNYSNASEQSSFQQPQSFQQGPPAGDSSGARVMGV